MTCGCGADGAGPCAPTCAGSTFEADVELFAWPLRRVGGQHTNSPETGVLALHKPTCIAVVSTSERSQYGNRTAAIERLHRVVSG